MRKFGLIGSSLSHSFSPAYFQTKFEREGLTDCSYAAFELDSIEELPELIQKERPHGLNVTIPYKEAVITYLNSLDEHAAAIGAVNVISITSDGLRGHNTDWKGFAISLSDSDALNSIKRALILGTGGASKAICYALDQLQISYKVIGRNTEVNYANISDSELSAIDLIINCTPLGMYPNTESAPEINYAALSRVKLAYDLIYNPVKTTFLKHFEKMGVPILNGQRMLEHQAELSWNIWNDQDTDGT